MALQLSERMSCRGALLGLDGLCCGKLFSQLLPLFWQNLRAEWSEEVVVTDASEWELGAAVFNCQGATVAKTGGSREVEVSA